MKYKLIIKYMIIYQNEKKFSEGLKLKIGIG